MWQPSAGQWPKPPAKPGAMQRSFYVGDIPTGDIKAKYEDGILRLSVPKADVKKLEAHNVISIE